MDPTSGTKPLHRPWLVVAAKATVAVQMLAIVYVLTSPPVTIVVATGIIAMAALRPLIHASEQVDRIFKETR